MLQIFDRIQLNVSGQIFETRLKTLDYFDETLLGTAAGREQFYCKRSGQFFLNRNTTTFESILFFYQSKGRLYRPPSITLKFFLAECEFYALPYYAVHILKVKERAYLRERIRAKHFPEMLETKSFRMKLWNTLENPGANVAATCFYVIQVFAIFLSITVSCLESLEKPGEEVDQQSVYLEIVLSIWFLLETLLRAIVSPDKVRFFSSVLNWCDILAVAPHSIIYAHKKEAALNQSRFIRVLRVLRLRKISPRTKAVCMIFKDSSSDLYLFFFGLLIAVLFGSSTIYHLEMNHKGTNFTSIPEGMWWGIQSFLTVGYGDVVPQTIPGRIFASMFMILGMDTVLLPVLSLIMKFADFVSTDYLD